MDETGKDSEWSNLDSEEQTLYILCHIQIPAYVYACVYMDTGHGAVAWETYGDQ